MALQKCGVPWYDGAASLVNLLGPAIRPPGAGYSAAAFVRQAQSYHEGGPRRKSQTAPRRSVDLAAGLAESLAAWDATSKAIALHAGKERSEWVFPAADGDYDEHRYPQRDFQAAAKAAGLPPHHTPHSLRHTYASLMLQQGESIYYVQRQLGHATIQLTIDLYGRWLPAGDTACVDRLEARLAVREMSGGRGKGSPGAARA